MKYIISESKLDGLIYDYIDKLFSERKLNYGNPPVHDEWGHVVENKHPLEFFFGSGSLDEDICFKWVSCDYFYKPNRMESICPMVILEKPYEWKLNSLFGELWKPIFKKWFTDKFNLPVKTIKE